jgi:Gamma-glutamyl cyclotransferase, AIG2-like
MAEPHVDVFFYGSYMNLAVLREVNIVPDRWEVARLRGYDIRIEPRANLVRADSACVYGVLAAATHEELKRLYAHAKDVLGETYLPEAVLTETIDGRYRPALCYIAPEMTLRPAPADYVDRIVDPARELGFPDWYVERLSSFKQQARVRRNAPSSMMILVAGPYRSGSGDDPVKLAAKVKAMESYTLPLFRAGHIPIVGEWLALPLVELAGSTRIGDAAFNEVFHPIAERLVSRCDAILRVGGPSAGADEMVRQGKSLGKMVFERLEDVPGCAS